MTSKDKEILFFYCGLSTVSYQGGPKAANQQSLRERILHLKALDTALAVAKTMDDQKGVDIQILRIEDLTILTEYFVIASGSSTTHVRALADEVEKALEDLGVRPHHREGFDTGGWVLLDYGSVVVHIFLPATRDFYSLDRLWEDAEKIELPDGE